MRKVRLVFSCTIYTLGGYLRFTAEERTVLLYITS